MTRFLLGLALVLSACQGAENDMASEISMDMAAPASEARMASDIVSSVSSAPDTSRILVRTASLSLHVDDYRQARLDTGRIADRMGALVSEENEARYEYEVSNTLTLRVPTVRFDTLLAALAAIDGDVTERSVSVEDVTEQAVDLAARLRARRAVEARYVEILSRAGTVEDVLAVEARLAETREEIERADAQLRALRDRVSLSTIRLTLSESSATSLTSGPGFFSRLGDAFGTGWDVLLGLVVGLVSVWPVLLLVGLGAALWRRTRQRRRAD